MHVTLHLTTGCNLSCKYCYSPPTNRNDMSSGIAHDCIDFIAQNYPVNTGIIFFGGEPLLKKDLIRETIEYANSKAKETNTYFHYKVTTNGVLLDESFMQFANSVNLQVAMSVDGNESAHNTFRAFPDGSPSFGLLQDKIDLLLQYQPYAKVLMTVSPENLKHYADSVEYLINRGFKYLIVSLNYAGNWTDNDLTELRKQYRRISALYERFTLEERKFYFSPFEMKLASHIRQDNLDCYKCHLAQKQISIAHDGTIYPCVQFVKDGVSNKGYAIGDVRNGIDVDKQKVMYDESQKCSEICEKCSYNPRCNNKCSCLNWQLTGNIMEISPVVCETERVLIPIVDALGEKLYRKRSPMFIQKHYNTAYPIISMLEDMHH